MEIKKTFPIPVDSSALIERNELLIRELLNKVAKDIDHLVPIGYTIVVDDSGVAVCRTVDFNFPEHANLNRPILLRQYGRVSSSINTFIEDHATAKDIYRISGLMQLIVSTDMRQFKGLVISK